MRRLVKVSILLIVLLFGVNVAVLGAARLNYRNPFVGYEALMPGHSMSALQNYPCDFQTAPGSTVSYASCQFSDDFGMFRQVRFATYRQRITRITAFGSHLDKLYLGDLILCWGEPIRIVSNRNETFTTDLYWSDKMHLQISIAQVGTTLDYFLPVNYLIIDSQWHPCGSGE